MAIKYTIKWPRPTYRVGKPHPVTGKAVVYEDSPIYVSKCGHFKITGHMMCGLRNGTFNVREYRTWQVVDGQDIRIGTADKLADAKMDAELVLNPNWEPA